MNIPKSFKDISITQFIAINDLLQDDSLDELDRNIKLISILTNQTVEQVENQSLTMLNFQIKNLGWLKELKFKPEPKDFQVGKIYFKMPKDLTQITTAQFIDLSTYTENPENILMNLPNCLASICKTYRKIGPFKVPKYLTFKEKAEILNKANIGDVYPNLLFFWTLFEESLPDIQLYLNQQITEIVKEAMTEETLVQDSQSNTQQGKDGY